MIHTVYIFHPMIPNEHSFPSREGILGLAVRAQTFNCQSRLREQQQRNTDLLVVHAYPKGA